MTRQPDEVLSDFIDAWNAGRRPRVREYLALVPEGAQRDELAEGITTWLEHAPTPELSAEARERIRGEPVVRRVLAAVEGDAGLWPQTLPTLRERAGLSIGQLARAVVERFGLSPGSQPRAQDYLEQMERGELEPSRVSRRLLDAIGEVLGASGRSLQEAGMLGRGLQAAGGTLYRADADVDEWIAEDIDVLSRAALAPAPAPLDELDRLFVGGPEG